MLFGFPTHTEAEVPLSPAYIPESVPVSAPIVWDKDSMIALATKETKANGVNTEHFIKTMECEVLKGKDGAWIADGQSLYPHKGGPGGREDSWGPMMIHLPDHPEVSKVQAQDPAFAIPWAVQQFKNGNASAWTCWRMRYA